jgi:hypothetical protein
MWTELELDGWLLHIEEKESDDDMDVMAKLYFAPNRISIRGERALMNVLHPEGSKRFIVNVSLVIMDTPREDDYLHGETIHLAELYNYVTLAPQDELNDVLRQFRLSRSIFYRLGKKMLCAVLQSLLDSGRISLDDIVGLEADGSFTSNEGIPDRVPLAHYYQRHYGFVSDIPLNSPIYNAIPMRADVQRILEHCHR